MVKGIGPEPAKNLIAHRPYKDLREISQKTDTKLVDLDVIGCLCEAGVFNKAFNSFKRQNMKGKARLTRDQEDRLLEDFKAFWQKKFRSLRLDMKAAAKRGVESGDIFGD